MLLLPLLPLLGLAALASAQSCGAYDELQAVVRSTHQCFIDRSTAKKNKYGKLRQVEKEAFRDLSMRIKRCFSRNKAPACSVGGAKYNVFKAKPLEGDFPDGVTGKNCMLCGKTLENIKDYLVEAPAERRACVNTALIRDLEGDIQKCQQKKNPGKTVVQQEVPNFDKNSHEIQKPYEASLNLGMAYRLKLLSCAASGQAKVAKSTERCMQRLLRRPPKRMRMRRRSKMTCKINKACFGAEKLSQTCAAEAKAGYQQNCNCFGPVRAKVFATMNAIPDNVIAKIGDTYDMDKCNSELMKEMTKARKLNANSMSVFGEAETKCFGKTASEAYSDQNRVYKICFALSMAADYKKDLRYQFAIIAAFTQATMDRFERLCFC